MYSAVDTRNTVEYTESIQNNSVHIVYSISESRISNKRFQMKLEAKQSLTKAQFKFPFWTLSLKQMNSIPLLSRQGRPPPRRTDTRRTVQVNTSKHDTMTL